MTNKGSAKVLALLFIIGIINSSDILSAQNDIIFDRLSLEDGLSNSYVTCILQDSKGFMWIGTQDGLNKYDGYNFTVFKYDPADTNSLSDNYIKSIVQTKDGLLWIGTENGGLNRFDPTTKIFVRYKHMPEKPNSLSHNNVMAIYEDRDESGYSLWIGTGGGLDKFDPVENTFTRFRYDSENNNSLSNNTVRAVLKDKYGVFWIGTDDGLNQIGRAHV